MLGRIATWFYSKRRTKKKLRPTAASIGVTEKKGMKAKGGWRYDSHLGIEYLRSNGISPSKYPQLWKSNRWTVYLARILGEAHHPLGPSRAHWKGADGSKMFLISGTSHSSRNLRLHPTIFGKRVRREETERREVGGLRVKGTLRWHRWNCNWNFTKIVPSNSGKI